MWFMYSLSWVAVVVQICFVTLAIGNFCINSGLIMYIVCDTEVGINHGPSETPIRRTTVRVGITVLNEYLYCFAHR